MCLYTYEEESGGVTTKFGQKFCATQILEKRVQENIDIIYRLHTTRFLKQDINLNITTYILNSLKNFKLELKTPSKVINKEYDISLRK